MNPKSLLTILSDPPQIRVQHTLLEDSDQHATFPNHS